MPFVLYDAQPVCLGQVVLVTCLPDAIFRVIIRSQYLETKQLRVTLLSTIPLQNTATLAGKHVRLMFKSTTISEMVSALFSTGLSNTGPFMDRSVSKTVSRMNPGSLSPYFCLFEK